MLQVLPASLALQADPEQQLVPARPVLQVLLVQQASPPSSPPPWPPPSLPMLQVLPASLALQADLEQQLVPALPVLQVLLVQQASPPSSPPWPPPWPQRARLPCTWQAPSPRQLQNHLPSFPSPLPKSGAQNV